MAKSSKELQESLVQLHEIVQDLDKKIKQTPQGETHSLAFRSVERQRREAMSLTRILEKELKEKLEQEKKERQRNEDDALRQQTLRAEFNAALQELETSTKSLSTNLDNLLKELEEIGSDEENEQASLTEQELHQLETPSKKM